MAAAALSIVWSPFALMGAAPFLLKAGVEALRAREVRPADLAAPAVLAVALIPVALYLTGDSGGIARGFQPMNTEFLLRYPAFLALELLPFVAANALFPAGRGGKGPARSTYALAVASLVLIPFYRIGASNDFAMRASIPALAILAVATGHGVASALQAGGARRAVLVGVVALGGLTGLEEVWHTLRTPNEGASTCDFVQAWDQSPYSRQMSDAIYLAHRDAVPGLLRATEPQVLVTGPFAGRCVDRRM